MRTVRCALSLLLVLAPAACQTPTAPAAAVQEPSLRERAFGAENRGRFSEAGDAFLALAKAEPHRTDWVISAGRCLARSNRFKEAVEVLDAARKTFPEVIEIRSALAGTLLLQAERDQGVLHPEILWADAAELAEGVLQVAPDHEDSRLLLAQVRYLQGDRERAIEQAEDAVRRHPARSGAHILLGRIATDRWRELMREHSERQLSGQEEADLVGRIDAQRQLAKRSFQRAAELDPQRVHPHVALGQLAFADRRPEEGRAHFVDALAIDPDVDLDHRVFERELDWQARRAVYAKARERYAAGTTAKAAKTATLWFYEGRACFEGSAWADAKACFEQALAGNADSRSSYYYLFLCAYQQGDHDTAERHAATYAGYGAPAFADVVRGLEGDKRGEVGAIVRFLADRAYAAKRIETSRDLNHVIACLVDSADAWNNHAFLCRETKLFDEAFASYEHALEKEPDSPQLLNDAAVVLQYHLPNEKNLAKARTMYERAVQTADKVLADARVTGAPRERAAKAKADAKLNLEALPR